MYNFLIDILYVLAILSIGLIIFISVISLFGYFCYIGVFDNYEWYMKIKKIFTLLFNNKENSYISLIAPLLNTKKNGVTELKKFGDNMLCGDVYFNNNIYKIFMVYNSTSLNKTKLYITNNDGSITNITPIPGTLKDIPVSQFGNIKNIFSQDRFNRVLKIYDLNEKITF